MARLLKQLPYGSYSTVRLPREVSLHALVRSAGRSNETGREYRWDGMKRGSRPFAVVQVTLCGRGQITTPDGAYSVSEGEAMIALIPGEHVYRVHPAEDGWDFAYAVIYGSEVLRLLAHLSGSGPVVTWGPTSSAEQALYALILSMNRSPRATVYELSRRAYALATSLLERVDSRVGERWDSTIARSLEFLHANITSPLTVDELARVAGYARHHFTRRFKEKTGLAPIAYMREARCERAAGLLATTRLSVKEIAAQSGFESSSYFCRVFLQSTGFTPSEFRKSRP